MNSYATIYDSVRGGMLCIGKLTVDFDAGIGAGANGAITTEIPGTRVGDVVLLTPITGLTAGVVLHSASITDVDEITVALTNSTAGGLTPGETVFQIMILKRKTEGGCDTEEES